MSNIRISLSEDSKTMGRRSKWPLGDGGTQPLPTMALVSSRFARSPITEPSSRVYAAYRVCGSKQASKQHSGTEGDHRNEEKNTITKKTREQGRAQKKIEGPLFAPNQKQNEQNEAQNEKPTTESFAAT